MNGGPVWLEPREDNVEAANEQVAENLVNEGDDQVIGCLIKFLQLLIAELPK
jgi:hypothetical protein